MERDDMLDVNMFREYNKITSIANRIIGIGNIDGRGREKLEELSDISSAYAGITMMYLDYDPTLSEKDVLLNRIKMTGKFILNAMIAELSDLGLDVTRLTNSGFDTSDWYEYESMSDAIEQEEENELETLGNYYGINEDIYLEAIEDAAQALYEKIISE